MGINRYMLPAEHNPGQSYIPQYVPLPIDDLDKALTKVEAELERKKQGAIKMGDKEWNNLSPDQKRYHELRTELDADVDKATNLALSDLMAPGARGRVNQQIADMTRKWSKQFKKGGEAYDMNANYSQRVALKKSFKDAGVPQATIDRYMMGYDSQYAAHSGIGPGGLHGEHNPYGTRTPATYVNVIEDFSKLAKEMNPTVLKNTAPGQGVWKVMEDFFEPGQLKWWQQQMVKDKETVKQLMPKMIAQAMTNAIRMSPKAMDSIYQDVIAKKMYRAHEGKGPEYYEFRRRGDDDLEAAVKQEISNYANTLGGIHKQYEHEVDQDQVLTKYPDKYLDGRDEETGKKKEPIILDIATNAVQHNNSYTSNPSVDKQTINGDDIIESLDSTIANSKGKADAAIKDINELVAEGGGGEQMFKSPEIFTASVDEWAKSGFDPNSPAAIPGMTGDVAQGFAGRIQAERQKIDNSRQYKEEVKNYVQDGLGPEHIKTQNGEYIRGLETIDDISENSLLTPEKSLDMLRDAVFEQVGLPQNNAYQLQNSLENIDGGFSWEDHDNGVYKKTEGGGSFISTGGTPGISPGASGYAPTTDPGRQASLIADQLLDKGHSRGEISDFFNAMKLVDSKNLDDIKSIGQKERELKKAKQKLRKEYVEKHPKSKLINRQTSSQNAVPFYKAKITPNGVRDIVLDKEKSTEALKVVTDYIDLVKQRTDLQWDGINVDDEGTKESEGKTTYANWLEENEADIKDITKDIEQLVTYSDDVIFNPETRLYEGGYLVTESIKNKDGGLSQVSFAVPEATIDPYRYNTTENDAVVAEAGKMWKNMKNNILDIGMAEPWKDNFDKYNPHAQIPSYMLNEQYKVLNERQKEINNNKARSESREYTPNQIAELREISRKKQVIMGKNQGVTSLPTEFKDVNGELRMYQTSVSQQIKEKDVNGNLIFTEEESNLNLKTLMSEEQTKEHMMNKFINDIVLSGRQYSTKDGHVFRGTVVDGEQGIYARFNDGKEKFGRSMWDLYKSWYDEKVEEAKSK